MSIVHRDLKNGIYLLEEGWISSLDTFFFLIPRRGARVKKNISIFVFIFFFWLFAFSLYYFHSLTYPFILTSIEQCHTTQEGLWGIFDFFVCCYICLLAALKALGK